jgi:TRAP-type mannitol/chloroaromatic compound transport system substrate-binding protein
MKRREFVSALGLGAAGAVAAITTACAPKSSNENCATVSDGANSNKDQQKYSFKLATSWPKNFPGLGMAPERLAKIVEEMSNGRMHIKVYGAGELVPAFEVFDAVSSGTADIGHAGAYYWAGKSAATQFFTAVPFGLTAQEINSWIQYGGGQQLWEELYAPFNLVPRQGGNTGVQMAGWFNKEVNSLADLKGLKMRIPGLGGKVFEKAGGVSVTLPGAELYTSMQTGVIDATEWVGPYNDMAFGLYEVAKYYYYPGWHEPGAMLEFTFNKTKFDSLPADLKAILDCACREVNQNMLDEYTSKNNQALKTLVETHKVQLRKLPDDVLKKLKEISREVVEAEAQENDLSKRIYKSVTEFAEQARQYHLISELAYLQAREL